MLAKAALQRGPLIYCLEQADQQVPLEQIYLPRCAELHAIFEPETLGGVMTLPGPGLSRRAGRVANFYRERPPAFNPVSIKAIPYYAWDNRQPGAMQVWLPEK